MLHQVDHLVKFDTKVRFFFRSRYELWLEHLFQHAADHRRWKVAAANKMNVYSPGGEKKLFKPSSTSSLAASSYVEPVAPSKPEKEVTFNFPSKVSSLSMSMSFRASKRQKRVEAKKSFKRTRSKLVLMYNQTGMDWIGRWKKVLKLLTFKRCFTIRMMSSYLCTLACLRHNQAMDTVQMHLVSCKNRVI